MKLTRKLTTILEGDAVTDRADIYQRADEWLIAQAIRRGISVYGTEQDSLTDLLLTERDRALAEVEWMLRRLVQSFPNVSAVPFGLRQVVLDVKRLREKKGGE